MGIHLADQTLAFLYASLLGAGLGLLYDAFRILRIAFPPGKGLIFAQDVVFFVLCALATFLFLLTTIDGVVRMFLLIGELIGAVLYHCTLGQLVMKVAQAIIDAVTAVIRFIIRYICMPVWRFLYGLVTLLLRPVRYFSLIMKKSLRRVKFRLKIRRMVLYNHFTGHVHRDRPRKHGREKRADGRKAHKAKEKP